MLTTDQKEEFKKIYRAFADGKDEITAIQTSCKDLVKTFGQKVQIKPAALMKTLNYLYKKSMSGEDMISEINGVLCELEVDEEESEVEM
jgi:predicted ester cyclase